MAQRPVAITLVATLVVVAVLTTGGLTVLSVQRRQLLENLDATLSQRADDLVSSELDLRERPLTLANLAGDDAIVQIVGADGTLLAASDNGIDVAPIGPAGPDGQVIRTVGSLPVEDDEYRVLSRPIDTDRGPAVVHVATNTDDLREVIARLRAALWSVIPAAALVMSLLVWILVGRTLRPVEAIRREVAAIGGSDLDHRVSPPATGDEIDRLATTMNEMLDRRAEAARRQQQFVADASHELRSPIARMRTELDVQPDAVIAPVSPDSEQPVRSPLDSGLRRSLSEEVDHLTALVDDLLHLARSDSTSTAWFVGRSISTTSCSTRRDAFVPTPSSRSISRRCRPLICSAIRTSFVGWCATCSTTPPAMPGRVSRSRCVKATPTRRPTTPHSPPIAIRRRHTTHRVTHPAWSARGRA